MKSARKLVCAALVCGSLGTIGCGTSSPVATEPSGIPSDVAQSQSAAMPVQVTTNDNSATDVISLFLDAIRRGGDPAVAEEWLTTKAKSELNRIGHKLQPIGSPDARFTVTRAENIPESPGSAFVHSYWEEPTTPGSPTSEVARSQIVWAVQRERDSWRISGFAVQTDDQSDPVILDFENGELMAKFLAPEMPQTASDAPARR